MDHLGGHPIESRQRQERDKSCSHGVSLDSLAQRLIADRRQVGRDASPEATLLHRGLIISVRTTQYTQSRAFLQNLASTGYLLDH
jgi:hypothetical protein